MDTVGQQGSSSLGIFRPLLIILGIIVFCILAYVALQFFLFASAFKDIPAGFRTVFTGTGAAEYYEFNNEGLIPFDGAARADGMIVRESVPLSENTSVVIASIPGTERHMVGTVSASGAFSPLYESDRPLASLSIRDGKVAFLKMVFSASAFETPSDTEAEDTVVEEGTADGPVDLGIAAAELYESLEPRIMLSDMSGETRDLGVGQSPRFHPDGSLVALSHEGIIRINTETGARETVFASPGGEGSISDDGTIAALRMSDTSFDVFDISVRPAYIGVARSEVSILDAAFIGNTQLLLRTENGAGLYRLPDVDAPYVRLIALMPVTN